MPEISIDEIRPGMILAKPICREKDGIVLLKENIELKESYIDKIKGLNLSSVCVHDYPETEEQGLIEPIREESRIKATLLLKTTFNQFKRNDTIDVHKVKEIVKEILDHILGDPRILYTANKIHAYDHYTFIHSIDVCVLSLLMGSIMGLTRNELEILGAGALLHDIGKIFTDYRIINKPLKLEPEEYEKVKNHSRDGYEMLRTRFNISYLIPHMAFQHHEREDGSGYPRGLTGKRIHHFSKIIAVADVFDAMTSYRVYKNPVPPSLAIQEIYGNVPHKYNRAIVDYFAKIVTPYSKGSVLLLSNNQTVEVIYISRLKCLVKVISGLYEGEIYNLYQKPELNVIKLKS